MLVDLARNDVGRVVQFGSEQVEELMTLERYSHVMHMTSQVAGDLAPGLGPIDVLRATFPAGTVSGAPKVRAMEIIDELEPTKRGPYAAWSGYVDFSGNLDTAIAIRTMVWRDGRATLQAGAGIVADSSPADESLECRNKAQALLTAAAAAARLLEQRADLDGCFGWLPASIAMSWRCGAPTPRAFSRASCRKTWIRLASAVPPMRCCWSREASSSSTCGPRTWAPTNGGVCASPASERCSRRV
jgi:hypothetical protein